LWLQDRCSWQSQIPKFPSFFSKYCMYISKTNLPFYPCLLILSLLILQTYERSYMQRWIDTGNSTCPKTQQKLEHLTLTSNYVLRSLITQWCAEHKVEQPTALANVRIKKRQISNYLKHHSLGSWFRGKQWQETASSNQPLIV
jgi:hypothetical protein